MKNIRDFLKIRQRHQFPKLILHFVIQKSNFVDIENFIHLAQQMEVDQISFDTLIYSSPQGCLLTDQEINWTQRMLKKNLKIKIKNNIAEVIKLLGQGNKRRNRRSFAHRYCQIVQSNLEISSEGIVVPCCMAYGCENMRQSLKDLSLLQIWRKGREFRKQLKKGKFAPFCYEKCNYELKKLSPNFHRFF